MAEIQGESPEAVAYELFWLMPERKEPAQETREEYLERFAACLLAVQHPERFSKPPERQ